MVVESLLVNYPYTRNSDELLTYEYLREMGVNPDTMPVKVYLKLCKEGSLASLDTLSRVRRKVQEEVASLRGKSYVVRLARAKEIQRNLGYPV
jgi:hypothetical protein